MPASPRIPDIIDGKTVKNLVEAHAVRSATVVGQQGGFAVVVHYGSERRAVAAQRSRKMRLWRNLNTAAAYVHDELHIERFEIDMAGYDPASETRKRPDTAERQRQLHEAAKHDAWFREQVEEALRGLEDGTNPVIDEEEMEAWLQERRTDLLRRIAERNH